MTGKRTIPPDMKMKMIPRMSRTAPKSTRRSSGGKRTLKKEVTK